MRYLSVTKQRVRGIELAVTEIALKESWLRSPRDLDPEEGAIPEGSGELSGRPPWGSRSETSHMSLSLSLVSCWWPVGAQTDWKLGLITRQREWPGGAAPQPAELDDDYYMQRVGKRMQKQP